MSNYAEVTQEIYDTVVSPWFNQVQFYSQEYRESVFIESETGESVVMIEGLKYRLDDLVPFAVKAMRQFGASVGVTM